MLIMSVLWLGFMQVEPLRINVFNSSGADTQCYWAVEKVDWGHIKLQLTNL